jgi:hypothetical protein
MTLKESAMELVNRGFSIFPLKPNDKVPATKNGCKDASADKDKISKWWDQNPNYNIGLATGNGLLVIDLDVKKENGIDTLDDWVLLNGAIPKTAIVRTGSGGQHYYYKISGSYTNKVNFMPGIDIRSDGGYVVAPPSIYKDGSIYEWICEQDIAVADQTIYDFLSKREKIVYFELPDDIPDGSRDTTLYKYACSLQAKGVPDEDIRRLVHKANEERCQPPLSTAEVSTKIKSALTKQKGKGGLIYPDVRVSAKGVVTILPTVNNFVVLLMKSGISLYYDVIKREIRTECDNKTLGERFNSIPNGYNALKVFCSDECTRENIKANAQKINDWIRDIADENRRNPAKDYLDINHMLWCGDSGLDELINCFTFNGDGIFYKLLIRKWLCQCVAMVHNDLGAYGADGVLVLKGTQGIGKTSFFKKLCVIGGLYFAESAVFNGTKDKIMENTSVWIAELGELPRSMKDTDDIKAFITSAKDIFRAPYDVKAENHPRYTSFGATTNDDTFLKDISNRRFWVIDIKSMDLNMLDKINLNDLWAEAYENYQALGQKSFRLTEDERAKLSEDNKEFRIVIEEERLLLDVIDWSQDPEEWIELTSTQICEKIGKNVSAIKVGLALKKMGYSKESPLYQVRVRDGRCLYKVPSKTILAYEFQTSGGREGVK